MYVIFHFPLELNLVLGNDSVVNFSNATILYYWNINTLFTRVTMWKEPFFVFKV